MCNNKCEVEAKEELSYTLQGGDWDGICRTGKKQSPVDVISNDTIKASFEPFNFQNYNQEINVKISNSHHTVKFEVPSPFSDMTPLYVRGGGFESSYKFVQGHLHWGSEEDNGGAEHGVDGHFSPGEVHLVHYNTDLGRNMGEAVQTNKPNALAVLSGRFVIGKENEELKAFFEALSTIQKSGQTTKTNEKIKLSALAPKNIGLFFRYNGSLTTPGCNEIVVWTLFKDPIEISKEQLDRLRKTKNSKNGGNSNNYRKVQKLNGRTILDSSSPNILEINIFLFITSIALDILIR